MFHKGWEFVEFEEVTVPKADRDYLGMNSGDVQVLEKPGIWFIKSSVWNSSNELTKSYGI